LPFLAGLGEVARVAGVQNGQDIALYVLVSQLIFCLGPTCTSILAKSSTIQWIIPETARELQALPLLVVDAVSRVVNNEQILRSVVIAKEAADVGIELELRFGADMQLDDVGVVVKAVMEKGLEFSGLALVRRRVPNAYFDSNIPHLRS
jgi:hypothetical protein